MTIDTVFFQRGISEEQIVLKLVFSIKRKKYKSKSSAGGL